MTKRSKPPTAQIVSNGHDMFVVADGVRIAKRGRPRTPQAKDVGVSGARLERARQGRCQRARGRDQGLLRRRPGSLTPARTRN